jgi:hypothetical protein
MYEEWSKHGNFEKCVQILVGNSEFTRLLEIPRFEREVNVKNYFRRILERISFRFVLLAQDGDCCWALVNIIRYLRIPQNTVYFTTVSAHY